MTSSVEDFVQNLTESGLLSAEEISAFCDQLEADNQSTDTVTLIQRLIESGRLTEYQADELQRGHTKGLVLGEYTVLGILGKGGMGEVYLGEHRRMKRRVAIKILPAKMIGSSESVKRFEREMQAAAKFDHPNIVTAHDAGEMDGIHFLVMQYVEGQDLASVSKKCGPLPVNHTVDFILQAAQGLDYAHMKGIVHRDIKPANLVLDTEGVIRILDMGLALIVQNTEESEDDLTSTGQMMGTADYMSPEQAEDAHRADHRTDIYSLGCTLYRLLIGRAMYPAETKFKALISHREKPIPSIRTLRPDVPEVLDEIYQKMVSKKPEERFQSMSEVIAALETVPPVEHEAGETVELSINGGPVDPLSPTRTYFTRPGAESRLNRSDRNETFSQQSMQSLSETVISDRSANPQDRRRPRWAVWLVALVGLLVVGSILAIVAPRDESTPKQTAESKPGETGERNPGQNDKREPVQAGDLDRAAAIHMLEHGATIRIAEVVRDITNVEQLPAGNIQVVLIVAANANLKDSDLEMLKDLKQLGHLDLSHNPAITDVGIGYLAKLTSLTELRLYHQPDEASPISDVSIDHLRGLKNLASLDLRFTELTDDGAQQLYEALGCKIQWGFDKSIGEQKKASE